MYAKPVNTVHVSSKSRQFCCFFGHSCSSFLPTTTCEFVSGTWHGLWIIVILALPYIAYFAPFHSSVDTAQLLLRFPTWFLCVLLFCFNSLFFFLRLLFGATPAVVFVFTPLLLLLLLFLSCLYEIHKFAGQNIVILDVNV